MLTLAKISPLVDDATSAFDVRGLFYILIRDYRFLENGVRARAVAGRFDHRARSQIRAIRANAFKFGFSKNDDDDEA